MVYTTPLPLCTPEIEPVVILQEAGRAPAAAWTDAVNLSPIGIRSTSLPDRSESLYRMSYPGPRTMNCP
jgi:hypothetical protein